MMNIKRMAFRGVVVIVLATFLFPVPAEAAGRLVPLEEEGWPQFRGPWRDGVSRETGLLQSWPEGGPALLWKAEGLGTGYSSPIVTNGTVYVTGDVGEKLVIWAYDLAGKLKWRAENGAAWLHPWPGARGACTYAGGRLYHMNGHGRVACFDAGTGRELWAVDTLARFEGEAIKWGLSECVLVDRGKVYVTPGGRKAFMAALDWETGETIWASKPLRFERTYAFGGKELDAPTRDSDKAGYASPILFESGGRRLLARTSAQHGVILDADTGEIVWKQAIYTRFEVIGAIPVFWKDHLYFSAPDTFGGRMFAVHANQEGVRVKEAWAAEIDNCHASAVCVDDVLYGAGYRARTDWVCIDAKTGAVRYAMEGPGKGTCVFADGRLYALGERGAMELIAPREDGFETVGRLAFTRDRKKDVWAHPVILDGRLYLRNHDELWCYDIRRTGKID